MWVPARIQCLTNPLALWIFNFGCSVVLHMSLLKSYFSHTISNKVLHMSHFSYACKMRCPLNLVLENCEYLWFYWTFWIAILDCDLWLRFPLAFNSYPCHASEMTRNTLYHCLKFALHSIFCHICYGKIYEKNFSTVIKVKLLVSKTSDSCF